MDDVQLEFKLFSLHAWWDGEDKDDYSIGWVAEVLSVFTSAQPGRTYSLIAVTWRGGWSPKSLSVSLLGGQIYASNSPKDFGFGPVSWSRGWGPGVDGWRFDNWKHTAK